MWRIDSVEATNLMTFDELNFTLSKGLVTVIFGDNKDNDSQKSNGAGKSALLEALAAGITGGALRKIKNGEIVQNGKKVCTISLMLTNEQKKEELNIYRTFYPKKSAQVMLSTRKIGEELWTVKEDLTSTNEANSYIEELLGISGEDLLNYFILSKSHYEAFLDASDTKKKETINRFSNGFLVDTAIDLLDEDLGGAKGRVNEAEAQYNQLVGKVDGVKESIEDALANESGDNGEQVASLKEKLESLVAEQEASKAALELYKENLAKAQEKADKLNDSAQLAKLKKAMVTARMDAKKFHAEMQELKEALSEVRIEIKELESKITSSVECPKCSHLFSFVDSSFDITAAQEELKELKQEELDIIADGKEARKDYDRCQSKVAEYEEKISQLEEEREQATSAVYKLRNSVSRLDGEIAGQSSRMETVKGRIEALQTQEKKDLVTPLRERLSVLEPQLKAKEEALEQVKTELENLVEQKDVFKRFKTHLANQSIKTIEAITNDFLEAIGSDIQIKIEGDTTLANGKSREKISATLYRDGVELGSFNKNSNGEKARINLATILTMNKLINLNAGEGKGLELIVIDEILDASDATGLMAMIRAMNKLGLTVLMVSHGALDANYEHTVTVEKQFGKSKIII